MRRMAKKDLSTYKRKYDLARHHAWAGLGLLSVFLAIRILYPDVSNLVQPILVILIVYILISILFTFKYYKGISETQITKKTSYDAEKEKIHAKVEKERLKLQKKKSKAEVKVKKENDF